MVTNEYRSIYLCNDLGCKYEELLDILLWTLGNKNA